MGKTNDVISSKLAYDGFIKIYEEDVVLENGASHTFCIIRHKKASCVLPITKNNEVVLVKQYRPALGKYTLEIPAGLLDEGETELQSAKRELLEETGYTTDNIEYLCKFYPSVGISNETIKIFIAKDVEKVAEISLDETEFLTVHLFSLEEVEKMIENDELHDSKTVISIMKYLSNKK